MRKILIFTFSLLYLLSCDKKKTNEEKLKYTLDSISYMEKAKKNVDSLIKASAKTKILDTTGMSKSPILVLKSELIAISYSNRKNIRLVYKNVSNKKISAIRFEWYGENAFNEPADMGNYTFIGSGGGFTDQSLNPGKTRDSEWDILSKDAKKIIAARAYEVAFSDGTTWKLHQDQ